MGEIYIAGAGMTRFDRHPALSIKQLTAQAVNEALRDCGGSATQVQAAFFGNSAQGLLEGQHAIRGQVALLPLGFDGIPIHNVEGACATGSMALHLAVQCLRAGAADIVLAVAAEKLYIEDKAKMLSVFDAGWDVETAEENRERIIVIGRGVEPPPGSDAGKPYSQFMDVYAAFGRRLIRDYGITQRQMAAVSAKNHAHAVHNERAQYRQAMTIDEVLAAPTVAYPLTLPMCSPVSDGAAAVVLASERGLKKLESARQRAVRVLASEMRSASARSIDDSDRHITQRAARSAFEAAGAGPEDIDVAELHDATAVGELMELEAAGLCGAGEAGTLTESGATALGGSIPVNTSGGLESKGHPVAASGLGQVFELVAQLRGEAGQRQVLGARLALQVNGGGFWGIETAVAHVGIFGRFR